MAIILNIETSTKNCSVAIAKEGKILYAREINDGNYSHAEKLHPFILDVLSESKISISSIDAIAVSKGPGSYTGLRIGVSASKGLCFALNKSLISVDTLNSLAHAIDIEEDGYIIPMLDARRMEVYVAVFNNNYEIIKNTEAKIIDEESFSEYFKKKVYFLGDGSEKCKDVIRNPNAVFIENKFPSANQMAKLSFNKYKKNDTEDVAYFDPFYLKDFIITSEKNTG